MTNQLAHFAIQADDIERARKFYAAVFAWTYQGYAVSMDDVSVHQSLGGFHG
jgi:predicted enzyme related to lactoylglutathione lyase